MASRNLIVGAVLASTVLSLVWNDTSSSRGFHRDVSPLGHVSNPTLRILSWLLYLFPLIKLGWASSLWGMPSINPIIFFVIADVWFQASPLFHWWLWQRLWPSKPWYLPRNTDIMMLLRLAVHEHRRAPCNLNYCKLYCSRSAVWVYRMGLLYTFSSVAYVHVINIHLMNVLRPRVQVAFLPQSRLIIDRLSISNLPAISICGWIPQD